MLEHSKGGLEASSEFERCYCGAASKLFYGQARKASDWIWLHALQKSDTNEPFLQFLFLEPNASDPLNKEAAEDLRSNREGFKRNVRTSMSGGAVKSQQYERVIGR